MTEQDFKQIKIRVSPKEHRLLGVAAAIQGIALTEFIRQSAVEAAARVVGPDGSAVTAIVEDARPSAPKSKTSGRAKK